ncbi:serine/arginine-rich SC35-like splicing factor SCL28 isoform X2 [Cryptomeria japonica]|uniref:serine/arginine-rich SC35-like splicing factor SCL28 isoform X2 n=1 Tax=Cryptomeria japonica TaxID=3369 RepID=UPI0027DA17F6|nr:serine/arginine-rich SC35-like splicing factor SCL28 isoform X2 [Cryptomeria japonica]
MCGPAGKQNCHLILEIIRRKSNPYFENRTVLEQNPYIEHKLVHKGQPFRESGRHLNLPEARIMVENRPEDLRIPFERFGPVKDVYLPRNYYTGEPRGFGFVKYRNPDDAAEAKYHMNHQIIGGREITIVFAEENRKNPQEMRANARTGRSSRYGEGGFRRRSPPRSPRRRRQSYTRSPSPPGHGSRGRRAQEDYYSDERSFSQSPFPRSVSRSPRAADVRSPRRASSPKENGRSPIRRQMPMQSLSPS